MTDATPPNEQPEPSNHQAPPPVADAPRDTGPRPAWREVSSLLFGKTRAADTPRAGGLVAKKWFRDGLEFIRFIGGAAVVYMIITTFIFRTFYIPSSSMEPTLELRDRVVVLNFAYGFSKHSVQFGLLNWLPDCAPSSPTSSCRIFGSIPKRGDVVVFRHPESREHLIKRVVGRPGDRVQVRDGQLFVNGEAVQRVREGLVRYRTYRGDIAEVMRYAETLPGDRNSHKIYEAGDQALYDNTEMFTVRPGHIFVMGDNRDNSNDSRSPTLSQIPTENLVGRAATVLFTFHSCREEPGLSCPSGRVWRGL